MEEIENQSYTATTELRWFKKYVRSDYVIDSLEEKTILQQLWQGSKGHQKWEDVPTVIKD